MGALVVSVFVALGVFVGAIAYKVHTDAGTIAGQLAWSVAHGCKPHGYVTMRNEATRTFLCDDGVQYVARDFPVLAQ